MAIGAPTSRPVNPAIRHPSAAGLRIAGGTDEILRNIIAERVLGLPGDLRPDKDTPFSELKPL